MNVPRMVPFTARVAALPAIAAVLGALPAAAQAADSAVARVPSADSFRNDDWLALLVVVLCGAAGAFASDLVADGGRLERWKREGDSWMLGFLGKLIVGSVAAVIMLSLNPAGEWWQLLGTALAAGVGGEAILLSIIAGRKAEAAEKDREQAEDHARNVVSLTQARMETLKQAALHGLPDDGLPPSEDAGAAAGTATMFSFGTGGEARAVGTAPVTARDRAQAVALLADRFSAEVAAFAGAASGTIRQRVRAFLVHRLGHDDVDSQPLGQIGGNDGVRVQIDRDIRKEWPDLNPRWVQGDTKADSTLGTLTNEIDLRGGR